MTTEHCDDCGHEVPRGRWCNRCGARLAPTARARGRDVPGRWVALVAGLCVALAGVAVAAVGWLAPASDIGAADGSDVVLDATAAAPSSGGATPAAPVVVERPGGAPMPTPAPRVPRTNVVCSDLRVRAVPDAELSTTREGELVELAPGPCVVMGPEGPAARTR